MAICPAPVEPDKRMKDWWVDNPWKIAAAGKSLSGYERNRIFLNSGRGDFYEISGLTGGADSDGDGRAVVPCDVTGDGLEDLIIRQAGGGPLYVFENRFPKMHWLQVSLAGVKSNRQGIGARLTADVAGRKLTRELFPHNTYYSQAPAHIHFGLGAAAKVDKLTVRWPSGEIQEFQNVAPDRRIVIREGSAEIAGP